MWNPSLKRSKTVQGHIDREEGKLTGPNYHLTFCCSATLAVQAADLICPKVTSHPGSYIMKVTHRCVHC